MLGKFKRQGIIQRNYWFDVDPQNGPESALCDSPQGNTSTARNFAFGKTSWSFLKRNIIENIGQNEFLVVAIVKRRTSHQRSIEKHVAKVVKNWWVFQNCSRFLVCVEVIELVDVFVIESTVANRPSEGAELHNQNHLGSSNVDHRWIIIRSEKLRFQMVHAEKKHQRNQIDPWHKS
ncbi:hypothetical protein OGATHE_004725 [Ogataea polymorpha]|uniref:Uncharacterized protein n=1 Tax=Ogataea polymorpha TaxID=460523 RepID=A0A9P8P1V6_9ASCO|nr:hypothetical protein OGATHE_004725 [Ogataea polymorpha]